MVLISLLLSSPQTPTLRAVSKALVVDVEGVDGGLEPALQLIPAPLRRAGGERVELTLGDGHDGERVALVGVGLGDVLKGVVEVALLVLSLGGLQHLGLRAGDGERLRDEGLSHLVGVADIREGFAASGVDVERDGLEGLDDVLVDRILTVDGDLLPAHGVVELVALAGVLDDAEAAKRERRARGRERRGGSGDAGEHSLAASGPRIVARDRAHGGDGAGRASRARGLRGHALLHERGGLGGDASHDRKTFNPVWIDQ
mmetsp:Transcript_7081/g.29301  ORF Transcript_7081/g.29301 Transcript_7081/m.29301 type:complete len:258 (+) Transcript_7081:95-868(+)